ncbi:hypothetical protein A3D03_02190 [Candidatus Gottesmanbacteria bacterium RIFCSPHIGHO2_02_FULL_40_13]|uniref:5'-deoxynucleotidase n=1 Tax=Candidatus Gottesmanbacteria bacterium RIFCSPHIGHO2_02_FULL_40_13 TaxID=1798384 RepID=A0A1F6A6J2_9BACT|nr:MAG: hypothetical protein A3D03_02190 [Candidatus Gottesmanbacteria bacterium RIFCSPHIGHO2_02_FULL_40_13]
MNKKSVKFLFEAATLKRLQRTGWQILGGGNQESIAEHSYMVCVISIVLAQNLKVNLEKILTMALFHDLSETRIGDIYKLADLYVKTDEKKARRDVFSNLNDDKKTLSILDEYDKKLSLESKLVHDADTLALILELKQMIENGNLNAQEWLSANINCLKLKKSKELAREMETTNSQDWWRKERKTLHRFMNGK